jgi:hypothetical protein
LAGFSSRTLLYEARAGRWLPVTTDIREAGFQRKYYISKFILSYRRHVRYYSRAPDFENILNSFWLSNVSSDFEILMRFPGLILLIKANSFYCYFYWRLVKCCIEYFLKVAISLHARKHPICITKVNLLVIRRKIITFSPERNVLKQLVYSVRSTIKVCTSLVDPFTIVLLKVSFLRNPRNGFGIESCEQLFYK